MSYTRKNTADSCTLRTDTSTCSRMAQLKQNNEKRNIYHFFLHNIRHVHVFEYHNGTVSSVM